MWKSVWGASGWEDLSRRSFWMGPLEKQNRRRGLQKKERWKRGKKIKIFVKMKDAWWIADFQPPGVSVKDVNKQGNARKENVLGRSEKWEKKNE